MFWQEDSDEIRHAGSDEVVDISFAIRGEAIPVDHAYDLSQALLAALPWLEQEENAGIHLIHVAASGNGWYRPDAGSGQTLQLSKRTRMSLRVPRARLDDARKLCGRTLDVGSFRLSVGAERVKTLTPAATLFSRYVLANEHADEETFLSESVSTLGGMGIRVKKALCGKCHVHRAPGQTYFTRSLMLADLRREDAIVLQQKGLGQGRKLGFGIFIPHKGIAAVGSAQSTDST